MGILIRMGNNETLRFLYTPIEWIFVLFTSEAMPK